MLIPNHPDDERLSALASGDADATADISLTVHVSECTRCTDLVGELGALRESLAELPDVAPSRPLRLLPSADGGASRADRVGGWARRFFAPVLTAGAALALVGLVGTTTPAFRGEAVNQDAGSEVTAQASESAAEMPAAEMPAADGGAGASAPSGEEAAGSEALSADDASSRTAPPQRTLAGPSDGEETVRDGDEGAAPEITQAPAERSPWPMVLFAGVALMIGATLLRWILVPRAG